MFFLAVYAMNVNAAPQHRPIINYGINMGSMKHVGGGFDDQIINHGANMGSMGHHFGERRRRSAHAPCTGPHEWSRYWRPCRSRSRRSAQNMGSMGHMSGGGFGFFGGFGGPVGPIINNGANMGSLGHMSSGGFGGPVGPIINNGANMGSLGHMSSGGFGFGGPLGKEHTLNKYEQFIRNTSCFCNM